MTSDSVVVPMAYGNKAITISRTSYSKVGFKLDIIAVRSGAARNYAHAKAAEEGNN